MLDIVIIVILGITCLIVVVKIACKLLRSKLKSRDWGEVIEYFENRPEFVSRSVLQKVPLELVYHSPKDHLDIHIKKHPKKNEVAQTTIILYTKELPKPLPERLKFKGHIPIHELVQREFGKYKITMDENMNLSTVRENPTLEDILNAGVALKRIYEQVKILLQREAATDEEED